ncbi:type II toxin-antitoxin system VapC family toxin [Nostoc sp.]|uniref:type II toxin-antitoxin system VapC family toxin n=1 Tax=Nostoc sp. TaxID=1180 RepID=UPI002FF676C5
MLLDSNIIIYSAQRENAQLRELIAEYVPAVSTLSYLEVLGYHLFKEEERQYFEEFFQVAQVLPISQDVLNQAVILRQQK